MKFGLVSYKTPVPSLVTNEQILLFRCFASVYIYIFFYLYIYIHSICMYRFDTYWYVLLRDWHYHCNKASGNPQQKRIRQFFLELSCDGKLGESLNPWKVLAFLRCCIWNVKWDVTELLVGGFKYYLFPPRSRGKWSILANIFKWVETPN